MKTRINLIKKYLKHCYLNKENSNELWKFEWDYENSSFKIKTKHILNILNKFLKKKLKEKDIYKWANFIEMREDIDYEEFKDLIYFLANPEINWRLKPKLAKEIIKNLKIKN